MLTLALALRLPSLPTLGGSGSPPPPVNNGINFALPANSGFAVGTFAIGIGVN